jgi:hypothetical protein
MLIFLILQLLIFLPPGLNFHQNAQYTKYEIILVILNTNKMGIEGLLNLLKPIVNK